MNQLKLDAYTLKIIAIIGMFANHAVITWWDIIPAWLAPIMYAAGGLTFPIMAYFVTEGYRHTRDLKKYIFRLVAVGAVALPFHYIALGSILGPQYPLFNIMFSIAFGLVLLMIYDRMKKKTLFWVLYVIIVLPLSTFLLEWYFIGVTMILMYHIIQNENRRRMMPAILAGVVWFLLSIMSRLSIAAMQAMEDAGIEVGVSLEGLIGDPAFINIMSTFTLGCILAALLLKAYNGERGKNAKWLFYAFYPLHLALLAGVAWLI